MEYEGFGPSGSEFGIFTMDYMLQNLPIMPHSFPGVRESKAWYHLHAHAHNFPTFWEIWLPSGRVRTT